jgi:hypothetical protein
VIIFLVIFVAIVFGGLELARWNAARLRDKLAQTFETPTPAPSAPRREDCTLACDRLRICGHPGAGSDCPRLCREGWTHEKALCVQKAACEEIDERCFLQTTEISCAEACARARECRLLDRGQDCDALCRKEWNQEKRRCLTETPCEEISSACTPAAANTPCNDFCGRLIDCGLVKTANEPDCLDSCLTVDDPLLRDCAARVSCEMIELVCLAGNYDPACLDACDRAARCGALGDIAPDYCPAVCLSSWDEATISCMLTRGCDELGPVCLQRPDEACRQVCRKLISCDMEKEETDCAIVCTTDLADEARQCILEQPCSDIDRVCFGQGPDVCRMACDKAIACGFETDGDACYATCKESNDMQLVGCILGLPCQAIPQMCFR